VLNHEQLHGASAYDTWPHEGKISYGGSIQSVGLQGSLQSQLHVTNTRQ
jgi:hypothetical protein